MHLGWPQHALSQSRTRTHTFLGCTLHTCVWRKPCWCVTSLHWGCHSCGSCVATSYAALCFTLCSYKDSKRVSWFTLQRWHRAWHRICAVGSSVAAVLRHLGVKFQGCQLPHFAGFTVLFSGRLLTAVLETLAFLVAEKSLETWNLTVFWSVTHDFLPRRAHTIASFQLPFVSLHAAAPADVQGGVLALMHPKSSFCVCKSQHPRAQVSLFPTGGCRGSAWQGHTCISSCPFGQASL